MGFTSELDNDKRENTHFYPVPPGLHPELRQAFDDKYRPLGKRRLMQTFLNDWSRDLDTPPPSPQTIRNFLDRERVCCEFWLLDGLCQLLLGCSVDEIQMQQVSIPPQKDTKTEISEEIGDEHTLNISAFNPFLCENPVTNPNDFIGRKLLLDKLFEELARGSSRSLVGEGKIGKSSILWMICNLGPERLRRPPEAFIYLDMRNIYDEGEFFEVLCEKLRIKPTCRGGKLKRNLRSKGNQRFILCLDEIDNMANEEYFTEKQRAELCGLANEECSPLTLVTASERPLRYLFPDSPNRSSPLAGLCRQIDVGRFSPEEARELLTHRLKGRGVTFSESQISELVAESNCHPDILQQKAADLYRRLTQQ